MLQRPCRRCEDSHGFHRSRSLSRLQNQPLLSRMSNPLSHSRFYPLINVANAKAENASMISATLCAQGALDPKKVEGKILLCLR
uniref:Uncharacterized protein n=1 Tax=Helianthus annuus TaxID=4232 RepID=A0A251RV41_HELAN